MMNLNRGDELTFRQQRASFLAILLAVIGLILGYSVRQNVINATTPFENKESGIVVRYPAQWLREEDLGDPTYRIVLRVQDARAIPFKTTLQIGLIPVGPDANATDVLNTLNISRGDKFSTYRRISSTGVTLRDSTPATEMIYAYAFTGNNELEAAVPLMIRAVDVVVIRGGQAIVITYQADDQSFEKNRRYFDAFLNTLELR